MAFFLYALLFCLLFYGHFALAHRAWLTMRGRHSGELDMGYVRIEDYFGQSFRTKLAGWMQTLPKASNSTAGLTTFDKGPEKIYATGSVRYPAGRTEHGILAIDGDFACGSACRFERELLVKGDCSIGEDSTAQALAVDGALHIGRGSRIQRWADAAGAVTLGPDSHAGSRVTSRASIEFLAGAQAFSLFAPVVFTESRLDAAPPSAARPADVVVVPHPLADALEEHGYSPRRLYAMGANTYLYDGDLSVTAPLHLRYPLVVRGNFWCARESLIEADLKAHGSITVGAASVVKGNLTAERDIVLHPNTYFQGLLHAGRDLRLTRGVRGLRDTLPVAAYATGVLTVESNVVVHGKLASARRVVAVSAPVAWLETVNRPAGHA